MSDQPAPSKAEALKILRTGDRAVRSLLDRMPARALTAPGIGGGEWSPKELIAHLAFWERCALEALDAWERGDRAPIDRLLHSQSLSKTNADGLALMSKGSLAQVRKRSDQAHDELLTRLRAMPTRRWNAPATPRSRRSLGERVGSILGGPGGHYRHVDAHLPDLRAFVEGHAAG